MKHGSIIGVLSLLTIATLFSAGVYAAPVSQQQECVNAFIAQGYRRISSANELIAVNKSLSASYVLTANIDLAEVDFQPIGTFDGQNVAFTGVLEGCDFTISNFSFPTRSIPNNGLDRVGLFWKNAGSLKNFNLSNFSIAAQNYVGALAAESTGLIDRIDVENVSVSGRQFLGGIVGALTRNQANQLGRIQNSSVRSAKIYQEDSINLGGQYTLAGGVAGNLWGASQMLVEIANTTVEDVVVRGQSGVGGIAGSLQYGNIANSSFSGRVVSLVQFNPNESPNYSFGAFGGIVGGMSYSPYPNGIFRCVSRGLVQREGTFASRSYGGLVGYGDGATVRESVSFANVVAPGAQYVGGFVGMTGLTIFDSRAMGNVIGGDQVGGFAGRTLGLLHNHIFRTYSTGSVAIEEPIGTASRGGYAGAVAGNNGTLPVESYFDASRSGILTSVVGVPLVTSQMQTTTVFPTWSRTVWTFVAGSYPRLAWEPAP